MPEIKINNKKVKVSEGKTILDAACSIGITIPTMCHLKEYPHFTSCMVCMVREKNSGKFLPSCTAMAEGGMDIETGSEEVLQVRKTGLELLLSEHTGDCEAPCRNVCSAHMNIPLMIRQVKAEDYRGAIKTAREALVLCAVLGRICPAPCENGCRRKQYDDAVSIKNLVRLVADTDFKSGEPYIPECKKSTGKKAAVIGSGPAGLSSAFFLLMQGHGVSIYDKNKKSGGALRSKVSRELLPDDVLDKDIDIIRKLGAEFNMNTSIGKDISMDELIKKIDAVVLAPGVTEESRLKLFKVKGSEKGIKINPDTFETELKGVFACGDAVRKTGKTVQSVAQGKAVAGSVDQYLSKQKIVPFPGKFNSIIGKLGEGEMEEFLKGVDNSPRVKNKEELTKSQAGKEAGRCLHCDCRKLDSCRLREYSDQCDAKQRHYRTGQRRKFTQDIRHDALIYESGKCIKCGICVRISEKAGIKFGYTFLERGFDAYVGVPFDQPLDKEFNKIMKECIDSCPTGALAYK